jgi:hypothetical protein
VDNGSWLGLFIPLPLILLLAGVVAVIVLVGVAFVLNQIVGLLISSIGARIRERKKRTDNDARARRMAQASAITATEGESNSRRRS